MIPTISRDELGDLSHALDIMRTRITETNKHLNELVNQKTGQLVKMNKDLIESKNRLESLNESLIHVGQGERRIHNDGKP